MKVSEVKIFSSLKKIFYVARIIINNNLSAQLQYRTNVIVRILGAFAELFVILVFFKFLYNVTPFINEWDYEKMLILILTFDIVKNLLLGCFVKNLSKIEDILIDGKLDLYITKPIDSQFYVSFQQISLGHIIQLIIPCSLLIFTLYTSKTIDFTIYSIILYIFNLLCGILIGYSLWISIMSFSFYIVKIKALHEIFLDILQLGKYPSSIYNKHIKFLLKFIFPILMIASYPTEIFLGLISESACLILIFITVITFVLSRILWKLGIRSYESAGG